jgi:alpha-L-fucosidase
VSKAKYYSLGIIVILVLLLMFSQTRKKYSPTWESLTSHNVPEWLLDAKFGIYAHWGVYSVPAFETEWYPKRL